MTTTLPLDIIQYDIPWLLIGNSTKHMILTKSKIDRMTYSKKGNAPDIRWDEALPNFGVRIYPSGKKAFVISYRVDGRKHLMKIGPFGLLTLAQARERARKELAKTLDNVDPLEARRAATRGETVAELCVAYMDRHAKPNKKSWKDDQQRIDKYILPEWRNRKVRSIKRSDVAALHSEIGNGKIGDGKPHPYGANRVLELISKMFSLAQHWGYVEDNAVNPAKGITPFHETKRDRWVTPDELRRLANAIDQEPNIFARCAIWLYLLTGVRKSELLKAKWEDVDWSRKELRLVDTKSRRPHYVPLSNAAIAMLGKTPRIDGNPYILPGSKPSHHLVNIYKPWDRVRSAAGIADVRIHDLRRTVGSWMAQAGKSLHLIGRVLNHRDLATTQGYARFAEDNVRQALEQHGRQIMGVAGRGPRADVVALNHPASKTSASGSD